MKIKISVIKIQEVNGKKVGKDLTFEMDPKEMAKYKTEATLRKKIDEYILRTGVFKKDDFKDLKYNMKDFLEAWKKQLPIAKEEELARLDQSENNPDTRITPNKINRLAPNEIFVFGSNAAGMHYGGAARKAAESFAAVIGQGHGPQGRTYAIDSMSGLDAMKKDVEAFISYA